MEKDEIFAGKSLIADFEAEHVDSDGDSSVNTGLKLGSSLKNIKVNNYGARNHRWGHTLSLGTISDTDE